MLPNKLQHGEKLDDLFRKYNEMVDYLRETRLVPGPGMRINRLPSGITIESTATASGGTPSAPPPGHPFDAEIINKGTEANPQYYARIYNSALPDSPNAGIVYAGLETINVAAAEISVSTQGRFYIDLIVSYDYESSPQYSVRFELRNSGAPSPVSNGSSWMQVVAEGQLTEIASRLTGDLEITGRWI